MVSDHQVRRLWKLMKTGKSLRQAALRTGMDEKTARKYGKAGLLPSQSRKAHQWRTRTDPFAEVWQEVELQLERAPGLEAKTVFEELQRQDPGKYEEGQLRTLQRRIKGWRAVKGPSKEVFFEQRHEPGQLSASDFTHMSELEVRIAGSRFEHLVYHFVLTYSNWESVRVCFSESFESLSEGLQHALWGLGGVPVEHRTDCLTTAVQQSGSFTQRYQALLAHYGLRGQKTQPGKAHENGDVEQSHHRYKRAVDQALLLRGSRDFANREEYEVFLQRLVEQRNGGRQARLAEEMAHLRALPERRLEALKVVRVRVTRGSTIHVQHNLYSVPSRLIGEWVEVRVYAEHLEVWYGQQRMERLPRLRGESRHALQYRHLIDWLVRKPGAFEQYRYRDALFPSVRFRQAYDQLRERHAAAVASKQYLKILEMAARESESGTDEALRHLLDRGQAISAEAVERLLKLGFRPVPVTEVEIIPVDLGQYDGLLAEREVAV
jgi:transposase